MTITAVLITGASKGSLGAEAAVSLAVAGPKAFILLGRSKSKLEPVISEINSIDSSIKVIFIQADFLDNASIRKAAEEINSTDVTIDSVIFSAGVMAVREFQTSKDGIEVQFAANYVGHFLLANLILGKLAKESTFVTVTSEGYELSEVRFDDYNFQVRESFDEQVQDMTDLMFL
jgi:NAD(P)-dependent dehydrogenase (short-subunit alcohol dehydrogenase family)